jgi:CspA family cold shock protein|tara:strand:+ start:33931 stop:34128 length:198 start_codon:yes stop_codon:yes gene_type:complete
MNGKVKFFNEQKGFGFVEGEDGTDYFIHISQLPPGINNLDDGQEVSFDTTRTEKGEQAIKVELVQ